MKYRLLEADLEPGGLRTNQPEWTEGVDAGTWVIIKLEKIQYPDIIEMSQTENRICILEQRMFCRKRCLESSCLCRNVQICKKMCKHAKLSGVQWIEKYR